MPDFEIKGDPGEIRSRASGMVKNADLFSNTGTALGEIDSSGGWFGKAADKFHDKHEQEPPRWWAAGGGFRKAGAALETYAAALEGAKADAKWAEGEYQRGQDATKEAEAAYADYTSRYIKAKSDALAQDLAYPYPKEPYVDPGAEIRKGALEALEQARRNRAAAARICAAAVREACRNAPEKQNFLDHALDVAKGLGDVAKDQAKMALVTTTFGLSETVPDLVRVLTGDLSMEEHGMKGMLNYEKIGDMKVAFSKDPKGFMEQLGKGMADWDTWADDPYRAAGRLIPDIVMSILSGGTAGSASKGLRTAAKVAEMLGDVGGSAGTLRRAAGGVDDLGAAINIFEKLGKGSGPVHLPDVATPDMPTSPRNGADGPTGPDVSTSPETSPGSPPTTEPPPAAPEAPPRDPSTSEAPESRSQDPSDSARSDPERSGPATDRASPSDHSPGERPADASRHEAPSSTPSPSERIESGGRGAVPESSAEPVGRGSVPPAQHGDAPSPAGVAPEPTRSTPSDPTPTPVRSKPRDLSSYELPNSATPPTPAAQPSPTSSFLDSRLGGHIDAPTSAPDHAPHVGEADVSQVPEQPGDSGHPDAHASTTHDSSDAGDTVNGDSSHQPDHGHDSNVDTPQTRSREDYPGLDRYTADGFEEMNARLRGLTEELKLSTDPKRIAELDRLIDLTSRELKEFPEHAGTTYRGTRLPDDVLARITEGGTFKEDAFFSTSKKTNIAEMFQDQGSGDGAKVRFEIDGRSGRDLTSTFAKEGEVLFDHGTNFDVFGKRWNDADGCWDIKLREADPQTLPPEHGARSPGLDADHQTGDSATLDRSDRADHDPFNPPGESPFDDTVGRLTDDGGWVNETDGIHLTPEQNSLANEILADAARNEPRITGDINTISRLSGAHVEGLDYRLKGEDSLKRKLFTDMLGTPSHASTPDVKDAVRFTFIHEENGYTKGVEAAREMMLDRGYESVELKNSWGNPGYQGINSTWRSPDGQLFELQHHTPTSFETKMMAHEMYEEQRLPSTSVAREAELEAAQRELFARVPVPEDAPGIQALLPEATQPLPAADSMAWFEDRLGGGDSNPSPDRSGIEPDADTHDTTHDAHGEHVDSDGQGGSESISPEDRYIPPDDEAEARYRNAVEVHGPRNPEGWIDQGNPRFDSGEPRWTQNCGPNARSFADTFQGNEARAPWGDGRIPPGEVAEMWRALDVEPPPRLSNSADGLSSSAFTSDAYERVETSLRAQPPGTVAVVGVDWDVPGKAAGAAGGHWFNAFVTDAGTVRFADQQTGKVADWPPPYKDNIRNLDLVVRSDGGAAWRGLDLS